LHLRSALSTLGGDEQVFNGASYTNWGFGVPLLQLPFQAAAWHLRLTPSFFFPDRAIYCAYFACLVPVLWAALDRLVATRRPRSPQLRRHALSAAATGLVLVVASYP